MPRVDFKHIVFLLFPLLQLSLTQTCLAQTADSLSSLQKDASHVEVRTFDATVLKKYSDNPEFIYDGRPRSEASLWDRFLSWLWDIFQAVLPGSGSVFWRIFWTSVFIAALFWLVLKIIQGEGGGLFQKSSRAESLQAEELIENIHEMDFGALIREAMADGNYRVAIRLYYLRALRQLNDQKLIDWRFYKTNQDYVRELRDESLAKDFREITRLFEWVWYGNFQIDRELSDNLIPRFERFENLTAQA